ncbi:uncharacterized protein LOC124936135 [Impatiens glandulifera]|uniref:uncharacterized protein LOC124936135 n=1 Tax=Impatiens glandulifera TaxID=253017 RepID=UPI001FB0C7C6|nr:uncharacterized protein LOC124936135 [Impatiens glandulifera]
MVVLYKGREGDEDKDKKKRVMAMGTERSKLHNFNLTPFLKWGNSRLLRCMKENPNGEIPLSVAVDRRSSALITEKRSTGKRGGSIMKSPSPSPSLAASGSGRRPGVDAYKHDEGIEAFGAKLMFDLQTEADKLKVAILKEGLTPPESVETDSSRPWNLRTRRAACKAPIDGNGNGIGKSLRIDEIRHSFSPLKTATVENRERSKFSVSLSKREIEEDFLTIVNHRPPRRPKKRTKIVQNELDSLFPGLWLTEVTADMYKVPDTTQNENVKRS